jgi:hypothetical protein
MSTGRSPMLRDCPVGLQGGRTPILWRSGMEIRVMARRKSRIVLVILEAKATETQMMITGSTLNRTVDSAAIWPSPLHELCKAVPTEV